MIENVNVCDTLDDKYHFVIECILFNDWSRSILLEETMYVHTLLPVKMTLIHQHVYENCTLLVIKLFIENNVACKLYNIVWIHAYIYKSPPGQKRARCFYHPGQNPARCVTTRTKTRSLCYHPGQKPARCFSIYMYVQSDVIIMRALQL